MEARVTYLLRVLKAVFRHSGRHREGWISAFGYTTAENVGTARRFTSSADAESFAFVLVTKVPHYIGRIEVVPVVWDSDSKSWKMKNA